MSSKLDKYLENASPKQKAAIQNIGKQLDNSTIEARESPEPKAPTPVAYPDKANASEGKLSETVKQRIEGMKNVEGNNHEVKKDNLSAYAKTTEKAKEEPQQEQDKGKDEPER